jgi:hypothetical protein
MKDRVMLNRLVLLLVWLTGLGLVCGPLSAEGQAPAQSPTAQGLPEMPDSVVSLSAVSEGDTVYLLMGTKGADKAAPVDLFLTRSKDGGTSWSKPVRIDMGRLAITPRTSRGNDAKLAARDGKLMAVWTASGFGAMGSGSLVAAWSGDGGETWSQAREIVPASTDKADAHGARFPAVAGTADGFHVIWIDAKQKARALGYTRSDPQGENWSAPRLIDDEMCACCWNILATRPGGRLYAFYRDICPSDMGLLLSMDGGAKWEKLTSPGGFNWTFDGCPHIGGGLAFGAIDPQTPAAVRGFATAWTGKDDHTGGYFFHSDNAGRTWSRPIRLGEGSASAVHTAVGTDAGLGLCVAWDAAANDGGRAVYVDSTSQRTPTEIGKSARLVSSKEPGATATHPLVVGLEKGFVVFWTEQEGKAGLQKVRMQRVGVE